MTDDLLRAYADSAAVQGMRASGRAFVGRPHGRLIGRLLRAPALLVRTVRTEGAGAAAVKVRRQLAARTAGGPPPPRLPAPAPAPDVLAPRALIVAELSIPQCAKYRVWQRVEQFALLGTACTVLPWHDTEACRSALQTHALAIFYRVPGHPPVLQLIAEAKALGLPTFWEADDLVFDVAEFRRNANVRTLPASVRRGLLEGVALYRTAMLAAGHSIASTPELAEAMRDAGAEPGAVVENALDAETLRVADAIRARRATRHDRSVLIAYGSGTRTHDADFALAAPALAAVMRERPSVRLRLIGHLAVPAALAPFADRIEQLPAAPFERYLDMLGEAEIAIAPLEPTRFNDAKSSIKFLEASILGVPSVCSARAAFRDAVREGETGFLAEDDAAWRTALLRLVDDPGLRVRIGEAARQDVLDRVAPATIAERALRPLLAGLDRRARGTLRVLAVNIYFAPQSFGGATVVAEEMARRLHCPGEVEVAVFTSSPHEGAPYTLRRWDLDGITAFGIKLPAPDPVGEFDDPEVGAAFADVLRAVEPDVVHVHCLPGLGSALLRVCQESGVPYVVTLHDAWWLCARQFMVTGEGRYCFQTTIDLRVCEACVPGARFLRQRFAMLQQGLHAASFVLSPGEAHRQLHLQNGLDPARTLLNRNGVRPPARPRARPPGREVRFGYVGGRPATKGYDALRAAFAGLDAGGYTLVLVDAARALGLRSMHAGEWRLRGRVEVVPPYRPEEVDAFFDGVDVLLFPSQWKESFGLIVAEALLRDVWVVVTEGVGAAEYVVDGENGTIIPLTDDPAPLRRAVASLLAEPRRLVGHRNGFKDRIRLWDEQAAELLSVLRKAAAAKTVIELR